MLNLFRLVLVTLDQDICRFFKDREDQTKITYRTRFICGNISLIYVYLLYILQFLRLNKEQTANHSLIESLTIIPFFCPIYGIKTPSRLQLYLQSQELFNFFESPKIKIKQYLHVNDLQRKIIESYGP